MAITGKVDFLVIGAQKAGTTSLFEYLRTHPQLYLPFVKEVGFFSNARLFSKGAQWYLKHFSDAAPGQLVGEVSPQYMMHPEAPQRIHALFPDVKLVAILRNPIDRAYSSYRMAAKRGAEALPLHEALPPPDPAHPSIPSDFIRMGLYGEILKGYLRYFPAKRIKIIFAEELQATPRQVLADLFKYLEVDDKYSPPNIHRQYHRGGKHKYPFLQPLKWVIEKLEKLLPMKYRGWSFRFDRWNTKPVSDPGMPIELRKKLAAYYEKDTTLLEQLCQVQLPWEEFHHKQSGP